MAVLSLGLGYEWDFDETVRKRNPKAVMIGVDPTIQPRRFAWMWLKTFLKMVLFTLKGDHKKVAWNRWQNSISRRYFRLFRGPVQHVQKFVSNKDGPQEVSIPTLVAMLGDIPKHGLVLKMDIEGSEYGVIPDICEKNALISTLAVEFHDVTTQPDRFNHGVERLREHFSIVHIHGNNCVSYSSEEDFPDALEITFIHKDLCPKPERPSQRTYPDPDLDMPNLPGKADYVLVFEER